MLDKVIVSQKMFLSLLLSVPLLTFAFLSQTAVAEDLAKKSGWEGGVSVVTVGFSQKSQFTAEDDNTFTNDLYNAGKSTHQFTTLPLFHLNYTLSDLQTQIFFGNNQDNVPKAQFALQAGVLHVIGAHDQVSVALIPTLPFVEETWQDPFLTGQQRHKTKEEVGGGRIKYEHTGDNAFNVQYVFAKNELDVEESGKALLQLNTQQRAMLNRNAELHRFSVSLNCPVDQGIIIVPSFHVTTSDAKGDANDFAEGVFKLQSIYATKKHLFSATLGVGKR